MPDMDCATTAALAAQYEPLLRFHPTERLFPVDAAAWLSHCSGEPWSAGDAKLRGTALFEADVSDTQFAGAQFVQAACTAAGVTGKQPISDTRGTQNHEIGNPRWAAPPDGKEVFLDFAGWEDPNGFSSGDLTYLAEVYSALGNAVNPARVTATPLNGLSSSRYPATFGVPQPTRPTVYCEVEWAGTFPRIDKDNGAPFAFAHPSGGTFADLDNYVALTYYYLYPGTEPPTSGGVRRREAQWEAITIFLKGDASGQSPDRRPRGFSGPTPRFVVYSQGLSTSDDIQPPAECRPWDDPALGWMVMKDGDHPVAFVSAGSHRNLFLLGQPGGSGGGSARITATNVGPPGVNDPLYNAASGAFGAGALLTALGGIGWPLMALALILLLLSFLVGDDNPPPVPEDAPRDDPVPPGQEKAEVSANGPAGLPSGGTPGGQPPGATGSVTFALHVVNRFYYDLTGRYPQPGEACEHPPWWDYGGRWGVKVVVSDPLQTEWDSGSRRADRRQRSRAFWHAAHLQAFVTANPQFQL
jgi:hypothetical protein